MTLVKICGIRTVDEGRAALDAGADYLGFVLWPHSRRSLDFEAAARVIRALRAEAVRVWKAVGVFVDPTPGDLRRAAEDCGIDVAQLSGNEPTELVQASPVPTLKALHVEHGRERGAARDVRENAYGADGYLLDTHADGLYGGTGEAFDWAALRSIGPSCFVAGGLRPDNVAAAIDTLAPRGVDVSGGVEYPGGGKDPLLVAAFIRAVREHDRANSNSQSHIGRAPLVARSGRSHDASHL